MPRTNKGTDKDTNLVISSLGLHSGLNSDPRNFMPTQTATVWKQGLCRSNYLRPSHTWLGVDLVSVRGDVQQRWRKEENSAWMETEVETGLWNSKPRNASAGWQLPEAARGARSESSLGPPEGTHAAKSLQKCEKVNLCCLTPPSSW